MIYFIYQSYTPNTAIYNRALAYLRSIEKMTINVNVVFLLPDEYNSRICDHFKHVSIEYCWDHCFVNNKFLKYLCYYRYLRTIKKRLKRGDKVYIYGSNDILHSLIGKKGVDFFFEITEHPEVYMSKSRLYMPTLEQHIDLCKKVTGLIVISSQLKDYYISKGVSASKVYIVNMIVDPERFLNVGKLDNNAPYLAYCGTVLNTKDGVDDLLMAFSSVSPKHPEMELWILGAMPRKDEVNSNIEIIREKGIEDKVHFTGVVSSEEMPRVLKGASALLLARPNNKQAKYGFPTKLGEYLLTGRPVVITSVGDIPLFLTNGVSALISEPSNPKEFAEKIEWLLNHPDESIQIGLNGKEVALKHFNALKETAKLVKIIQNN